MGKLTTCSILCSSLLVLIIATTGLADDESSESKGHGFGEKYDWVPYAEAYTKSKELNKPVMMVIHKSWCGACKSLGPKFAASEPILEMSDKFVMVNVVDDEEPKSDVYTPDGGYIPRTLFLDSDGKLLDIINESGNPKYKYFYQDDTAIVDSMKKALALFSAGKDEL